MEWRNFKHLFHKSWHKKMKVFIESEECDKIYAFLKKEGRRGKKIAPSSSNVYRAFYETSLDELEVVIMGMCPYHTFTPRNEPIADGLLMGCSITNKLQPSLEQFYNAIEVDQYDGINLNYNKNPDVSYLCKQGVLMLNAALTTEKNKAGSHLELWEPFIKYLFEEIINEKQVPVVYLGKETAKYIKYRGIFSHDFPISHPASASYKHTEWDCEKVFRKVDTLIQEQGGFGIQWLDVGDTTPY